MVTQKQAIATIRKMGATVKVSDGEYRVNIPKGTEGTAYYCSDPQDAIMTAKAMMQQYRNNRKPHGRLGIFGA